MTVLASILSAVAAVCVYAGLLHVIAGWRNSFSLFHIVFAAMAFFVAAHTLAHIGLYSAHDLESYLAASRWSNLTGTVAIALVPWFAYVYASGARRWVPAVLSGMYVLCVVIYEILPRGLFEREVPRLVQIALPWGGSATVHRLSSVPPMLVAFWAVNVLAFSYVLALSRRQFRRGLRSQAVALTVSNVLLLAALAVNALVVIAGWHSLFLAEFGFATLVVVMMLYSSSHESYSSLVEQASDGIFLSSPTGNYVDVNRAACEMLGYTRTELCKLNITDVVMPDEQPRVQTEAEILKDGKVTRREWQFRRKDGTSFIGEVSGQMLSDGRLLGVVRDVTEHMRVHSALRLLAEAVPDTDSVEFAKRCASTLAQAFGVPCASVGVINPADDSVQTLAFWCHGRFGDDLVYPQIGSPCADLGSNLKWLIVRDAGRRFPNHAPFAGMRVEGYFGAAIFDASGRKIGIVEVWGDQPLGVGEESQRILEVFAHRIGAELERVAAHAELRQLTASLEARVVTRTSELGELNKQLEAFSYSVSHDLRAPVRAVAAFSDLLLDEHGGHLDPAAASYIQRIRASATHMNDLIEGLLELARVSHSTLAHEPVDLSQIAQEALGALKERDPWRTVDVVCPSGITAIGDPRLLSIVVHNLLDNAWKYTVTSASARIEFNRVLHGGQPVYYVKDTGIGFDMQHTAHLFEPFRRLHAARDVPGSGIGLATVARIIERHGGRVWAESTPGRGATFYFTLPGRALDEQLLNQHCA
jgi:PAS domain S-box-containing protein